MGLERCRRFRKSTVYTTDFTVNIYLTIFLFMTHFKLNRRGLNIIESTQPKKKKI